MSILSRSNNRVTSPNSADNNTTNDVIGNKTDNGYPATKSLASFAKALYYHVHSPSWLYPPAGASVTLTSSASANTHGSKVEIIPLNTKTGPFDIHFVVVGNISANGFYEINLYDVDALGAETLIGQTCATRSTNQSREGEIPIQVPVISANHKISASLACSAAGAQTLDIVIFGHSYP